MIPTHPIPSRPSSGDAPARAAWPVVALVALLVLLAGCATHHPRFEEGQRLLGEGRIEDGLAALQEASVASPGKAEYRAAYVRQRELAIARLQAEGDYLRSVNEIAGAEAAYRRVLAIEPANARAKLSLGAMDLEQRHRGRLVTAQALVSRGELVRAEALLKEILLEDPANATARALQRRVDEGKASIRAVDQLGPAFNKPVTLEFREANIRQVFELIARTSGINFVFDKDVRPDTRVTIFVRNTNIDDLIQLILRTNQLARKVLNDSSILIYPNTPAKQREYVDLVVRSFYLGNADAKQALNLIKTVVKTRDVYIDDKLNLLVMRDTSDAVRMAEKLITAQDLAEPEVMLDVEVLEVSRTRLQELGIRFPDRINYGPLGAAGAAGPAAFALTREALTASVANPAIVLNLKQTDGATNLLANPRIRVRNREKAKIHIGEKVPVVTQTATVNVGLSASVTYLDVGLKLDVEPNIHLGDDIAIKVGLEVSNIIETVDIQNTRTYRLGTRNANTTLRVRNGETQVLAGLINDEDRSSANKVPGLGDFPGLGRLFSSNNDTRGKTEIVLLITPRVVRSLALPEPMVAEFAGGTDAAPGAAPIVIRSTPAGSLSISSNAGGSAPPVSPGSQGPLSGQTGPGGAPGSAGPVPSDPSGQRAPGQAVAAVSLAVPVQVAVRSEFNVSATLQSPVPGTNGTFDVTYDPVVLEFLGPSAAPPPAAPGAPSASVVPGAGRVAVRMTGPGATVGLRFRVIAQFAGPTEVAVSGFTAQDSNGQALQATAPVPRPINVVQ
jgi:general secretion pathway protein D